MRYVLALILLAGITGRANADVWTWFSYESDAAAAAIDKGKVLELIPSIGDTITVHQWVEVDFPMEFTGMSSDLLYSDCSGAVVIDNYSVDVGEGTMGYWATRFLPEVGPAGVEGYGGMYLVGAPLESYITAASGVQHVASFDITVVDVSAMPGDWALLGGIGDGLWSQTGGLPFDVQYGASVIGSQDTTTLAPVVLIPEPSTISLLSFLTLVLIRRR